MLLNGRQFNESQLNNDRIMLGEISNRASLAVLGRANILFKSLFKSKYLANKEINSLLNVKVNRRNKAKTTLLIKSESNTYSNTALSIKSPSNTLIETIANVKYTSEFTSISVDSIISVKNKASVELFSGLNILSKTISRIRILTNILSSSSIENKAVINVKSPEYSTLLSALNVKSTANTVTDSIINVKSPEKAYLNSYMNLLGVITMLMSLDKDGKLIANIYGGYNTESTPILTGSVVDNEPLLGNLKFGVSGEENVKINNIKAFGPVPYLWSTWDIGPEVKLRFTDGYLNDKSIEFGAYVGGDIKTNRLISAPILKPSRTHTISYYARRVSGTGKLFVAIDGIGNQLVPFDSTSKEWIRVHQTITTTDTSSSSFAFYPEKAGDLFEIDCVQVELGEKLTRYNENRKGIVLDPETKIIIRNNGVINDTEGTVEIYAYEDGTEYKRYLIDTDGKNRFSIYRTEDKKYVCLFNGNLTLEIDAPEKGWHLIAVKWKHRKIGISINGINNKSVTFIQPISFQDVENIYVGSSRDGDMQWINLIDDIRFSNIERGNRDIFYSIDSGLDLPVDGNTTYMVRFDGNLLVGAGAEEVSRIELGAIGKVERSDISWSEENIGKDTTVKVEISTDGGLTWREQINEGYIFPQNTVAPEYLLIRKTVTTKDISNKPSISDIKVNIESDRDLYITSDRTTGEFYIVPERRYDYVQSSFKIEGYTDIKGICNDGENLWASVYGLGLIKITRDGELISEFNYTEDTDQFKKRIETITYDNINDRVIGITSSGRIYEIEKITGDATLIHTLGFGGDYSSIAFDGTYYWCYDKKTKKLYQTNGEVIVGSLKLPIDATAMVVNGDMALFVGSQKVYEMRLNTVNKEMYELEQELRKGYLELSNEFGIKRRFIVKNIQVERKRGEDAWYAISISGSFAGKNQGKV